MATQARRKEERVPLIMPAVQLPQQAIQKTEKISKIPTTQEFEAQSIPTIGSATLTGAIGGDFQPISIPEMGQVPADIPSVSKNIFQPQQDLDIAQVPSISEDFMQTGGVAPSIVQLEAVPFELVKQEVVGPVIDQQLPEPATISEAETPDIVPLSTAEITKKPEPDLTAELDTIDEDIVFKLPKGSESDKELSNRIIERSGVLVGGQEQGSFGRLGKEIGGFFSSLGNLDINRKQENIYRNEFDKLMGTEYTILGTNVGRLSGLYNPLTNKIQNIVEELDVIKYDPGTQQYVDEANKILKNNDMDINYGQFVEAYSRSVDKLKELSKDIDTTSESVTKYWEANDLVKAVGKKRATEMLREVRESQNNADKYFKDIANEFIDTNMNTIIGDIANVKYGPAKIGRYISKTNQHFINAYKPIQEMIDNGEMFFYQNVDTISPDKAVIIKKNISDIRKVENIYKQNLGEIQRQFLKYGVETGDSEKSKQMVSERVKSQGYDNLNQYLMKGIKDSSIGKSIAGQIGLGVEADPQTFFKTLYNYYIYGPTIKNAELPGWYKALGGANIVGSTLGGAATTTVKLIDQPFNLFGDFGRADLTRVATENLEDLGRGEKMLRSIKRGFQGSAPELLGFALEVSLTPGVGQIKNIRQLGNTTKLLTQLNKFSNPTVRDAMMRTYNISRGAKNALANFLQGQVVAGGAIDAVISQPYTPQDAVLDLVFSVFDLGAVRRTFLDTNFLSKFDEDTIKKWLGPNPSVGDIQTARKVINQATQTTNQIIKNNPELGAEKIKQAYTRSMINNIYQRRGGQFSPSDILLLDNLAKASKNTTVSLSDMIMSTTPKIFDKSTGTQKYRTVVSPTGDISTDAKFELPNIEVGYTIPDVYRGVGITNPDKIYTDTQVSDIVRKTQEPSFGGQKLTTTNFIKQEDGRYRLDVSSVTDIKDNRDVASKILDTYMYQQKSANDFYEVARANGLDVGGLQQSKAYEQIYQNIRGITDNFLDC